jgi:hypothetical protein
MICPTTGGERTSCNGASRVASIRYRGITADGPLLHRMRLDCLPIEKYYVGSLNALICDVFTSVTMKDVVFWDMMRCGSSKNN